MGAGGRRIAAVVGGGELARLVRGALVARAAQRAARGLRGVVQPLDRDGRERQHVAGPRRSARLCDGLGLVRGEVQAEPDAAGDTPFRRGRAAARPRSLEADRAVQAEPLRLVDVDDLAPERRQRHRDQLEVGQAERDPDDRDAHHDPAEQVAERQPPAGEDDPDDVADHRARARAGLADERAPERPQAEERHPAGGDAERDRDDQDEHHERGERVAERDPDPAEDEPDQVQQQPHARPYPALTVTDACPVSDI